MASTEPYPILLPMSTIRMPAELKEFASVFKKAGFACYVVGGAVRDSLLGLPVADWDIATDALPQDVMKLFRGVIPTGLQHGTVTVRWRGKSLETTTFRLDGHYGDGRRPDTVQFTSDLAADLSRRDFTINGMAADPSDGLVVDPFGGKADLKAGIVRAIGDPLCRFGEDGLRPLRAVRFALRFGFSIEESTFAAIPLRIDKFRLVSPERVRDELSKMLACAKPSAGFFMLEKSGLLAEILPELLACRGVGQGELHRFDVLDHCLFSCDAAVPELGLRLAALLHDIAKPGCRTEEPGGLIHFYGHDTASAEVAGSILRRLKFPNATVDFVTHLIRHHMFDYSDAWTDSAVRRFASKVGLDYLAPLVRLRLADSGGMKGVPADPRSVLPLLERVEALVARDNAFSIKDLAVNGNDLAGAGIKKGPLMGRILAELLESVLEDPDLNTRERLLEIAKKIMGTYGDS